MTNEEIDKLVDDLQHYQFFMHVHQRMEEAADVIKEQLLEIESLKASRELWKKTSDRFASSLDKWAKFSERHGWLDPEDFDHWIADLNAKLATEVKETVRLRYHNAELERQLEAARSNALKLVEMHREIDRIKGD